MEVVATHTANDYYAATRHITRRMFARSPSRYIASLLGGLYGFLLAVSAVLLAQFLERYAGPNRDVLSFALAAVIIAFVIGVVFNYVYRALATRVLFRPSGYGTSPQRFKIEDDALVHSTRKSISRTAWSDIEAIEKTNDFIFAFLDRGLALYIARRAFSDQQAFDAFASELNAKVQANNNPINGRTT
jgi:hypothetical protein